jgi:hypothetical protein
MRTRHCERRKLGYGGTVCILLVETHLAERYTVDTYCTYSCLLINCVCPEIVN